MGWVVILALIVGACSVAEKLWSGSWNCFADQRPTSPQEPR